MKSLFAFCKSLYNFDVVGAVSGVLRVSRMNRHQVSICASMVFTEP